MMYGWI